MNTVTIADQNLNRQSLEKFAHVQLGIGHSTTSPRVSFGPHTWWLSQTEPRAQYQYPHLYQSQTYIVAVRFTTSTWELKAILRWQIIDLGTCHLRACVERSTVYPFLHFWFPRFFIYFSFLRSYF